MTRVVQMPMELLRAPISDVDAGARTFTVQWLSGARVKRYDWMAGQYYWLEFSKDSAAARLTRFASGRAPVLNAHAQFDLQSVLGVIETAVYKNGVGTSRVRLSGRDEVKGIVQDVADGIISNASIGVAVFKKEILPPDEQSEGLAIHLATDFEPFELSFVPVGADAGAAVLLSEKDPSRTHPCEIVERTNVPIEREHLQPQAPNNGDTQTRTERERIRTITNLCERNQLDAAFRDDLIENGVSIDAVRTQVLAKLAERTNDAPLRGGSWIDDHMNAAQGSRLLMAEARVYRALGGHGQLSEPARQYVGMSTVDVMRYFLELNGKRTTGLGASKMYALAMSTSDFPGWLGDVASLSAMRAYEAVPGILPRVARKVFAPDFRPLKRLQLSGYPSLEKVLEGGEITRGAIAEQKESYAVETFARIIGFTRQVIVNDQIDGVLKVIMTIARTGRERENAQFAALLGQNGGNGPTMSDANALFHAAHNNTGAGVIDVANVGAGVAKMRLQKDLDGKTPVNAEPRFLIVPAAKETVARQFVTSITPAKTADVQPYRLEVAVDPRLDAISGTAWYLAADPGVLETFEYAYLEGNEGLYVEQKEGWNIDGIEFKVRLDVGVGALDWRGVYRSTGL